MDKLNVTTSKTLSLKALATVGLAGGTVTLLSGGGSLS